MRFAGNERAATTLSLLAECFEELGGVPKVVQADRMGCLKGGVVANKVVPTADYVRFATHYCFPAGLVRGGRSAVEGDRGDLVGYAKRDLVIPRAPLTDLGGANAAARQWCAEVNGVRHSEICAIPAERLDAARDLLPVPPSLRPVTGRAAATRKVDRLSCTVRVGPLLSAGPADRSHRRRRRVRRQAGPSPGGQARSRRDPSGRAAGALRTRRVVRR